MQAESVWSVRTVRPGSTGVLLMPSTLTLIRREPLILSWYVSMTFPGIGILFGQSCAASRIIGRLRRLASLSRPAVGR